MNRLGNMTALALVLSAGCAAMREPANTGGVAAHRDARRRFLTSTQTWEALKEQNVVMQDYDYSCGAAAMATLLRYYWGDDVTEEMVLDEILEQLTDEEFEDRQENGLSMTDLRDTAVGLGYLSTMRRVAFSDLQEMKIPVIVRIKKDDYEHFVVYRGMVEDRIFLADPSLGNQRISLVSFIEQWNNVVLVVVKPGVDLPVDPPLAIKETPPVRIELLGVRQSLNRRR